MPESLQTMETFKLHKHILYRFDLVFAPSLLWLAYLQIIIEDKLVVRYL